MGKCSKIRCIVRLRQLLRRWRQRAAAGMSWRRGAGPAPGDVPAGHVAVCVGSGARRYVVRAAHLNHPVFRELLRQAEEEFGFHSGRPGPLALPCDESLFEHAVRLISSSSSSSKAQSCNLDDSEMLSRSTSTCFCCHSVDRRMHAADSLPLLHDHRLAEKPIW